MKILILIAFLALSIISKGQVDSPSIEIEQSRFKREHLVPTIQQLFADPGIDSIQYLIQFSGTSIELKIDQLKNQKKNLNESRLKKGGKSLELMEEKTFNNASDARKYVLEKLTSTSLVVTDKTALTSFKIRVYEVSHAKEKEM